MRIAVIGAGPGGICAGIKLKEAGFEDVLILEQAPAIGGTWWHNSYPGCRCDVQSLLYCFSFAPKTDWSEPYAAQPEIRDYLEEVVARFGLAPHIRLGTRVEQARWDEAASCWHLETDAGERLAADLLIGAVGLFNEPAYPRIAGLDRFAGTVIHSARWDHGHDLAGERVGVIGAGASAVQIIPEIAGRVGRLDVYQRTPNYVSPRKESYTEEELQRFATGPEAVDAERATIWSRLEAICSYKDEAMMRGAQGLCAENLALVGDAETRRRMTPDYPFGAKRGLVSSQWYPTFNRDTVHLVTDPIAEIREHAVVTADGTERETDTLILATGFQTTRFLSAIDVRGRGGTSLAECWREGARAYLGMAVPGFPNLFMLYGPNTNNGSILYQLESQVGYIVEKARRMRAERVSAIEVLPDALEDYDRLVQDGIADIPVWHTGVSDYYRTESGRIVTQWPFGMAYYRELASRDDWSSYRSQAGAEAVAAE